MKKRTTQRLKRQFLVSFWLFTVSLCRKYLYIHENKARNRSQLVGALHWTTA